MKKGIVSVLIMAGIIFGSVIISILTLLPLPEITSNEEIPDKNSFISIWNTTLTSTGSSLSNQISLPLTTEGIYDFTVDWGDGTNEVIMKWNQTEITHSYTSEGIYTITISGLIIGWGFDNGGDKLKILEIKEWGSLQLGNEGRYFRGCSNLKITACDKLNLSSTTTMEYAFDECRSIEKIKGMNDWDTSSVTDMRYIFCGASSFNQDIGKWNTSSVTNMRGMFLFAPSFNQEISHWDVSNVIDMATMFYGASAFNGSISNWNTSSTTNIRGMFYAASVFNQDIGDWNTSSVTDMSDMFCQASAFN